MVICDSIRVSVIYPPPTVGMIRARKEMAAIPTDAIGKPQANGHAMVTMVTYLSGTPSLGELVRENLRECVRASIGSSVDHQTNGVDGVRDSTSMDGVAAEGVDDRSGGGTNGIARSSGSGAERKVMSIYSIDSMCSNYQVSVNGT